MSKSVGLKIHFLCSDDVCIVKFEGAAAVLKNPPKKPIHFQFVPLLNLIYISLGVFCI